VVENKEFTIKDLPDGEYTVKVMVKDMFDEESIATVEVKKDTVKPIISLTADTTTPLKKTTILITSDGGLSGIKEVKIGDKVIDTNTYVVDKNGTYTFKIINNAGSENEASITVNNITCDVSTPDSMSVTRGKRRQLMYVHAAKDGYITDLEFSSADPSIATIDADGKVVGVKLGTTVVTVKSTVDGQIKAQTTVNVTLDKVKKVVKKTKKKVMTIVWKGVKSAKAYDVYRAKTADGNYERVARVKKSSFVVGKKAKYKKYYYKIVAVADNTAHNSEISNYAGYVSPVSDETTQTDTVNKKLKKQIKGVRIKAKKSKIKLEWTSLKKADSYIIYRAESESGLYYKYDTVLTNSYYDADVRKGRTYYYKVCAVQNDKGIITKASKMVSVKAK